MDTQDRILQFLEDTDPQYVNLCLDTGHIAYCDGDNIEIIKQAPERITYVHLKFVDPKVRQRVKPENLSLAEAVPLGVMVEPPYGEPESRRCSMRWPDSTGRSSPSSNRTCTRLHRTSRWASRPAPPATSRPAASAPSAAGPTELELSLHHLRQPREGPPMVKIALDPAMYHADLSVADEVRKAADLGYEYLELSPRADFFFWHSYPKADDAAIAEVKKACSETGVTLLTLVPVFNWSSPDEQERRAQVRNWRRLLQIAAELECPSAGGP